MQPFITWLTFLWFCMILILVLISILTEIIILGNFSKNILIKLSYGYGLLLLAWLILWISYDLFGRRDKHYIEQFLREVFEEKLIEITAR